MEQKIVPLLCQIWFAQKLSRFWARNKKKVGKSLLTQVSWMKLLEDHMWEILGSLTFNNYQMLLCSEVLAQKVTIDLDELCCCEDLQFSCFCFSPRVFHNFYRRVLRKLISWDILPVPNSSSHWFCAPLCSSYCCARSILMLLGRAQTSIDILFCSPGTYRRCLASTVDR